jgi:hypothetical protein
MLLRSWDVFSGDCVWGAVGACHNMLRVFVMWPWCGGKLGVGD